MHAQALKEFSKDNPDIGIIYLDSTLPITIPGTNITKQQGNVASIWFKTQEVGFLAGIASAAWASKNNKQGQTPIIAAVGGQNIPPVTMYLAGYEQGMDYFNGNILQQGKTKVRLYLRDVLKKPAKYFGGFEADPNGQVTNFTKQAINAGVDVIFPCGGPQTFTAIRTLQNQNISPNKIKVIGVDQDLTNQKYPGLKKDGEWTKYVLASATKSIGNSIASLSSSIFNKNINGVTPGKNTRKNIKKDVFGKTYVGELSNNWLTLTGQKINGKNESMTHLFDSLNITVEQQKAAIKAAGDATPYTDFYYGPGNEAPNE